jgi:outer membrane protein assembly factor BamB
VDGDIHRVSAASGTASKLARVGGPLRCGPILWDDLAVVARSDGTVVAVDRGRGAVRFQTDRRSQPVVGLTAGRSGVTFADDGGSLVALDGAGKERWSFAAGEPAAAAPISRDGLIVFAAGKTTYVLDDRDGDVRVRAEITSWIGGAPELSGGRLYVGDRTGRLNVFDVTTGALLFHHMMIGALRASPVVVPEGVLLVSDEGQVTLIGT